MKQPVSFIDRAFMTASLSGYDTNPLACYLFKLFERFLSPESVVEEMRRYNTGCAHLMGGSTVWWQVDTYGRVRTGRIVSYDRYSGATGGQKEWVHKVLSDRFPAFRCRSCFFGSHLLGHVNPDSRVLLFEGEKDALMVALLARAVGEGMETMITPIACSVDSDFSPATYGMISSLSPMRALRDRCVNIFPSYDNYTGWLTKARGVPESFASVRVSGMLEPLMQPSWTRYKALRIEEIITEILHDRTCRKEHLADFLLFLYAGGGCPVRELSPL